MTAEEQIGSLQEQVNGLGSTVTDLQKSLGDLVPAIQDIANERKAAAEAKARDEQHAALADYLKSRGFLTKDDVASITRVTPKKEANAQQAVIQGQVPEDEEETPPPPPPKRDDETEPEMKKKGDEASDEEDPEKLKKQISELQKQVDGLPKMVEEALKARMEKSGWTPMGHAPLRQVGTSGSEVPIIKGETPADREGLINQLKKMPLAELNNMHMQYLAGGLRLPEGV